MSDAYMPKSVTVEWETPQDLFDELDREFSFTLDAAASLDNAKVPFYYDELSDGLKQSWDNQIVWCNPPYGRQIKDWVKKANDTDNSTIVMLIPSRTDTKWFHEYVYNKAEVRFIKGRLRFGGAKDNAPFPSMLVIWRPKYDAGLNNIYYHGKQMQRIEPIIEEALVDEESMTINSEAIMERLLNSDKWDRS